MRYFRRILTGVDLIGGGQTLSRILNPASEAAVERSLLLAEKTGAEICFATVLDADVTTGRLIHDAREDGSNVFDEAHAILGRLVQLAREHGIRADARVLVGSSWMKLIREVLRQDYDLVIVGARHEGLRDRLSADHLLLGSTAIKLLRKCPCPVWVAKPSEGRPMASILVAHDLRAVGRKVLDLGVALARTFDLNLIVVHGIEQLPVGDPTGFGMPEPEAERLHGEARERILLDVELAEMQCGIIAPPGTQVEIRVVNGRPEHMILDLIQSRSIDLLLMGTVGRSGIRGLLTGNTAERILPRIQCSLLAVKPDGFECPVDVE